MRGLYKVIIVDPEEETIIYDDVVFASSEEMAKMKAVNSMSEAPDLDDYDVGVYLLVRMREKERVKKVKVVD